MKPHVFEYISDDRVHLNKYGVREVGNKVVEVIKSIFDVKNTVSSVENAN